MSAEPTGHAPVFAVVGRVNKGKSSVLATLAEDDSVRVGPRPGTTTACRDYPVVVDGETLFVLTDTPGFEEASRALAWLKERETSAASRSALVAELVRAHEGTDELVEERRLLAPILAGASVIYVVDGGRPYRPNYEAEMEILRWTGRPGMALVNRIGAGDHTAEWVRALDQYFKLVRVFDAFSVSFLERMRLLESFRALRPDQQAAFDRAVDALWADRARRHAEAVSATSDLMVRALSLSLEVYVADEASLRSERERMEADFHDRLRRIEGEARRAVEELYGHEAAARAERELERPIFDQDLFASETWRVLGLSPGQLIAASAGAGAVAGGTVDAMVGGASFLAGTVLGAAIGAGVGAYGIGRRFARAQEAGGPGGLARMARNAKRYWSGGRRFRVGPHAQPNFPWVLLDRALLHYRAVLGRTHAERGAIEVAEPESASIVAGIPKEERKALGGIFDAVRREHRDVPLRLRDAMAEALTPILQRIADELESAEEAAA